jgi:hypothetical protein
MGGKDVKKVSIFDPISSELRRNRQLLVKDIALVTVNKLIMTKNTCQ